MAVFGCEIMTLSDYEFSSKSYWTGGKIMTIQFNSVTSERQTGCNSCLETVIRGVAKIQKKMDSTHPTYTNFFQNQSLTWSEHSNHND